MGLGLLIRMFGSRIGRSIFASMKAADEFDERDGKRTSLLRKGEKEMIAYRLASMLVEAIQIAVLENLRGNAPKSPFTRIVQGRTAADPPLVNTGQLLQHLKIRKTGFPAYTVSWDRKPVSSSGRWTSGRRAGKQHTALDLIRLHEDGFRVKKDSEQGKAMIRWMAARLGKKRLPPGDGGAYIYMPPRPFYDSTVRRFISRWNGVGGAIIIKVGDAVHIRVR